MTPEKEYTKCQDCGYRSVKMRDQPWLCSECAEDRAERADNEAEQAMMEACLEQARAEAREPLVQALRHCVSLLATAQKAFSPRVILYTLIQDAIEHADKTLKTLEK